MFIICAFSSDKAIPILHKFSSYHLSTARFINYLKSLCSLFAEIIRIITCSEFEILKQRLSNVK
jgi:hypothetical protein